MSNFIVARRFMAACVLGLSLPLTTVVQASQLPDSVAKVLKANNMSEQSLSMAAIPLTGPGKARFYNADTPINPASTMKLVTTYAALELLGPAYQWKTEFATDGKLVNGVLQGNLYFKGGGDPKLTMEKLWMLLRDLRANGVQHVTGDLVLDANYFALPNFNPFDDDGSDNSKPFLVEPSSLLVNFKAMRIIAIGEQNQAKISIEPPISHISVNNQVKILPTAACPDAPKVRYQTEEKGAKLHLTVSGELVSGCRSQNYVAYLDPARYTGGTIRSMWAELGGRIDGSDKMGVVPVKAKVLARSYSADLTEVIRDVNKYSNNTMAKQVFLSIGAQHRKPTDRNDADATQRVIKQWLQQKGLSSQHLVLDNGSGLSRDERVSAREMANMLKAAWQSPYSAELISSMPIAGMDGTLRNRMKNTVVRGQAHLKTGTLRNVRALAGYTRDNKGDTWAVVAIINDNKPWSGAAVIDQVILDTYRNP